MSILASSLALTLAMAPAVEANGLTASTSAPSRASTLGITNDVAP